jgi:hypothetical protein
MHTLAQLPPLIYIRSDMSQDTYHLDRNKHGGIHIDRRNKAGQTVGRYRLDRTPIPHK